MATQMSIYGYNQASGTDRTENPRFYENQPAECRIGTAKHWTVHFQVPDSESVGLVLDRVRQLSGAGLTGEYVYGDSWIAWGEKPQNDDDKVLHLYFVAETPELARQRGTHIANHAYFSVRNTVSIDYAISTAGDWAEQIPSP